MNIATVVPGGVVVFFCSYAYEKQVVARWRTDGTFKKLNEKKKVAYPIDSRLHQDH